MQFIQSLSLLKSFLFSPAYLMETQAMEGEENLVLLEVARDEAEEPEQNSLFQRAQQRLHQLASTRDVNVVLGPCKSILLEALSGPPQQRLAHRLILKADTRPSPQETLTKVLRALTIARQPASSQIINDIFDHVIPALARYEETTPHLGATNNVLRQLAAYAETQEGLTDEITNELINKEHPLLALWVNCTIDRSYEWNPFSIARVLSQAERAIDACKRSACRKRQDRCMKYYHALTSLKKYLEKKQTLAIQEVKVLERIPQQITNLRSVIAV